MNHARYPERISWIIALLVLSVSAVARASGLVPIWPEGVPDAESDGEPDRYVSERYTHVQIPTIEVFLPEQAEAPWPGVLICPGGGYKVVTYVKEGTHAAEWFAARGIAAFVLKYRLPRGDGAFWALREAQRAIRMIRQRAEQWHVDPNRVGVMGFSAGGHLASSAGTHFDDPPDPAGTSFEAMSARPDFLILIYPVITMEAELTHAGSRRNLLGQAPAEAQVAAWSNEQHVTDRTPPTFLIHGSDDAAVPVENSVRFYRALVAAGVPAELHLYEHAPHGFGMGDLSALGPVSRWPDQLAAWLALRGLTSAPDTNEY